MDNKKKSGKFNKVKLIVIAAFAVLLISVYLISVYATVYLHNRIVDNLKSRMVASNPGLVFEEHEFDSEGLFSTGRNFIVRTADGTLGFNLIIQSNFSVPFIEKSKIFINHPTGSMIKCDGCDFQSFVAGGELDISYISNSYNGVIGVPSFTTGKKISVQINPGTVAFSGDFASRKTTVDLNLQGVKYFDSNTNVRKSLENISGTLTVSLQDNRFFIQTDRLNIGKFYVNNRLYSDKLVIDGINLKVTNENSVTSGRLINSVLSASAKTLSYDNENYDSELDVNRVGVLLKLNNVDQTCYSALGEIFFNLYDFLHEDGHKFNYDLFKYFMNNGSSIDIDHILLVSTQSMGKFEIEKGSKIAFSGNSKLSSKERTALGLKFKITEQFLNDFPNHLRIKNLFITENGWLVHGSTDSKDEYSTKLTIDNGQCTLGEYFLSDC